MSAWPKLIADIAAYADRHAVRLELAQVRAIPGGGGEDAALLDELVRWLATLQTGSARASGCTVSVTGALT